MEYRYTSAFRQVVPRFMPAGLVLMGTACAVSPECVEDLTTEAQSYQVVFRLQGFHHHGEIDTNYIVLAVCTLRAHPFPFCLLPWDDAVRTQQGLTPPYQTPRPPEPREINSLINYPACVFCHSHSEWGKPHTDCISGMGRCKGRFLSSPFPLPSVWAPVIVWQEVTG